MVAQTKRRPPKAVNHSGGHTNDHAVSGAVRALDYTSPANDSIAPAAKALGALSPGNQELVITLIRQLAEREGVSWVSSAVPGLQTPAEGILIWLAHLKQAGYSPNTIDMYGREAANYLAQDPAPTRLSIEQHLAEQLDRLSPTRVAIRRKALCSLFRFLHGAGLWHTDPTAQIEAIRVPKRTREAPKPEHVIRLLADGRCFRKKDTPKFRTMLAALVGTGLRIDEACSLQRKDIDLGNGFARVEGKSSPRAGKKERFVPIIPQLVPILQQYMDDYPTDSPYLFPSEGRSGYWDPSIFRKSIKRACRQLGLPDISPHMLRHHFATSTLKQGAKLEVISRILGHASVGITADIYRHVNRGEMLSEAVRFAPMPEIERPALPSGH